MKTVRYTGPDAPPITIGTADGVFVTDDQGVVEVDDALAKTLTEQDHWTGASSAKTAAKTAKED